MSKVSTFSLALFIAFTCTSVGLAQSDMDFCPWDVTGKATQPDGMITEGQTGPWWRSDVSACEYVINGSTHWRANLIAPRCDVNHDGMTDFDDLQEISLHIGPCEWECANGARDIVDQRLHRCPTGPASVTNGMGYTVWVLGTGIDHTDADFGGRAIQVANFTNDDKTCLESGTELAKLVGGAESGLAPHVQIRGVKIAPCEGEISASALISGLEYVTANATSSSIILLAHNVSGSATVDAAAENAINSGVPVVVAAGEDGQDACDVSPARSIDTITVGATKLAVTNETTFNAANYGPCIDILAPGDVAAMNGTCHWRPSLAARAAALAAARLIRLGKNVYTFMDSGCYGQVSGLHSNTPNYYLYVDTSM